MSKGARTHGYSGKPLFQRLGLEPGVRCQLIGAPRHYPQLVAGAIDVRFMRRAKSADVVHLFCPNRATLDRQIGRALDCVVPGGMLWVSWPKKSSTLFVDLTEGRLRGVILPLDWVDVKVCAVDADWSALKFLERRRQ